MLSWKINFIKENYILTKSQDTMDNKLWNRVRSKFIVDIIIIGFLILSSQIIVSSISMYLLFFYILYRIMTIPIQFSLHYFLILVPNIGVTFIPGLPAPILNILILFAIFRIVLLKNKFKIKINKILLLISMMVIIYEWGHAFLYNSYNILTLMGWTLTQIYILFIISSNNDESNHLLSIKYFVSGVMISSIVGLITNILETGQIIDLNQSNVIDRFSGGAGDPNYYSLYILISLFCLIMLLNRKGVTLLNKALYYLIVFMLLMFGFMSLSRMYIIVLVFVSVIYFFRVIFSLKKYRKHKRFIVIFAILSVLFLMVFPKNIMNFIDLTISRFTMYESDLTLLTSGRNEIAESSLEFIFSNYEFFYFGVGIQDYGSRIGAGMGYAHNFILELLLALGIIGTILFLIYLFSILIEVKSQSKNKKVSFIGALPLLCMAISYMSINAIEVESFYLLLIFAFKHLFISLD